MNVTLILPDMSQKPSASSRPWFALLDQPL